MRNKSNSHILYSHICKSCGWGVVSCLVNWDTSKFKDSQHWDWWYYCSNKACENHHGEGYFQDWPEWIVRDNGH